MAEIQLFADYVCPSSYIGFTQLDRLAAFRSRPVAFRSYELRMRGGGKPTPPHIVEIIKKNFTTVRAKMVALDIPVGIESSTFGIVSQAAHEGAQFVAKHAPDAARAWHRAVFHATFVEGKDIGDIEIIRALAEQAMPSKDVAAALVEAVRSHAHLEDVHADQREATRLGVTSVPTFVVGGELVTQWSDAAELERKLAGAGTAATGSS